jgi:hypothetical protein
LTINQAQIATFIKEFVMPLTPEEIRQRSQAVEMVQRVLSAWDFKTWNQLLADDVVLTLNLGAVAADDGGDVTAVGDKIQVTGRDAAKQALREVYGDLKKDVSITGQLIAGYEAIFFGEMNVTVQANRPQSLPIAAYLQFNDNGKVQKLSIGTVDLRPLFQGMRQAATGKA